MNTAAKLGTTGVEWGGVDKLRNVIRAIGDAIDDERLSDSACRVAVGSLINSLKPTTTNDIQRTNELVAAGSLPDEAGSIPARIALEELLAKRERELKKKGWYCRGCDKWLHRYAAHCCPGRGLRKLGA